MRKFKGAGSVKKGNQQRHFTVRTGSASTFTTKSCMIGSGDDLTGAVLPGFKMILDWKPVMEAKPGQAKIGLYAHLGLDLEG